MCHKTLNSCLASFYYLGKGDRDVNEEEVLCEAMMKKALGYESCEVVEEYLLEEDGTRKLNKMKVTKKHVPPDIPAAKVLLDHILVKEMKELKNMTVEELEIEREQLLKQLLEKGEEE